MTARAPSARLDATPAARICAECAETYTSGKAHADFCSAACRKAWNNRRALRGAELYDLLMALRYDRAAASKLKVWRAVCRLASGFRDDDLAARAGRQSWRDPREILERRPYLLATTVARNVAGRRR